MKTDTEHLQNPGKHKADFQYTIVGEAKQKCAYRPGETLFTCNSNHLSAVILNNWYVQVPEISAFPDTNGKVNDGWKSLKRKFPI